MAIDPIVFGQRLRFFRKRRGLTLEQLGAGIGRPAPFLSLVENGKREPKLSEISNFADVLGVTVGDLLEPDPPTRRARLEVELERAQRHPRYRQLGLPYLKPSARLGDDALDHIVTLFDHLIARDQAGVGDTDEIRIANGRVAQILRDSDGYLADIEASAREALRVCGYGGPGPITSRHLTDLAAFHGYRIRAVDDIPASVRSVIDPDTKRIYVAQRNELRTRQARKAILQTIAAIVLGHGEPSHAQDVLMRRVETAYFAAAVLVPETSAVPFLQAAHAARDLSVEDLKEQFYVSYEMAAQRFVNLATRHLGLPTHFIRSDDEGIVWKAYANDGLPLPVDVHGGSEGQRLCRLFGARTAYSSADKFSIHHQFTDTPAGSFWCATHLSPDPSAHAFTVGARFEDARHFRGRRTNVHLRSECPDGACCALAPKNSAIHTSRSQHKLVAMLSPGLASPDPAAVQEFVHRHASQRVLDDTDDGQ
jgi:predicted transcriptional regulator/transcriptional regulator with XRE-family HTH domain